MYNITFTNSYIPIVGASGAVYGLLLAYGILFPNRIIYIYGIFPVKVKNAVILLGLVAFFYSITMQESGISHITHLAGMIVGLGYLLYWKNQKKSMRIIKTTQQNSNLEHDLRKKHIDEILDKVNAFGWDALSKEDKEYLQKESEHYYDINNPN